MTQPVSETAPGFPNIAVIGCGTWGKNLVRNFSQLGALRVIYDTNPNIRPLLQEQFPDIAIADSFESVLGNSDVQAVVVATPAAQHYAHARRCLESGKDVFFFQNSVRRNRNTLWNRFGRSS